MTNRSAKPTTYWIQWNEAEARKALAMLANSNLSIVAFARSVGVSPARIAYWRKKFAHGQPAPSQPATTTFIPVQLNNTIKAATVEIRLHSLTLCVPESTSTEDLAALFVAIARKTNAC
jgi:transposase-like protein